MAKFSDPLSRTPLRFGMHDGLIDAIWDLAALDQSKQALLKSAGLECYMRYYDDQCSTSSTSGKTHEDLLAVIRLLRQGDESLASLTQNLTPNISVTSDSKGIVALITLATRLWLMVEIGYIGPAFTLGSTPLPWQEDRTLNELIGSVFSSQYELESKVKLEKIFNACNLERIAGIRVSWTSNLADHLLMKDDDTRVTIFHYATFLHLHSASRFNAFPEGFVEETLQTLSLLLPRNNAKVRKWFRNKQGRNHLDPLACSSEPLSVAGRQIENFKYWRDRLVILKQAFDESEPKTIQEWWNDDRKRVQWWTFWIAALVLGLTIAFGLIESIAGIVQAWASVKGLGS